MNGSDSSIRPHRAPIAVFGIDALDVDLLRRWVDEGRLPFLARLLERGAFARLDSTKGLFGDAPWPSLNAGVSPAKHAFFNHLQLHRGTLDIERVDAHHCRYLPFWQHLRGKGLRVALMDVPKTFPVEGLDGVQVCGWGEHYPLLRRPVSIPDDLTEQLNARHGGFPHPPEIVHPPSREWEHQTREMLLGNVERKERATEDLLGDGGWQFLFSVFSEVHYADHQFLHLMDPAHWAHERDAPETLRDTLPDIATRTDTALARLFDKLPEGATWFVVSVHGIEPNFSANHMVEEVLQGLGYLVPSEQVEATNTVGRILQATRRIRELIPQTLRDRINARLPERLHDQADSSAFEGSWDWSRTSAFMLPSDHFQALLSLNLKGREPPGIVEPGSDADSLMEEIREQLLRIENLDSGKPAVADVVKTADVYDGPNLLDLPDLVVQWAMDGPIERIQHPEFGQVSARDFPLRRAQHAPDGFLIAGGAGIAEGTELEGARTIDFGPTVLHLLGQPVPDELDGRVLRELLTDDVRPRPAPPPDALTP
jgi:predicted AlkP superfamily phosphohydrolase/phosphomutase